MPELLILQFTHEASSNDHHKMFHPVQTGKEEEVTTGKSKDGSNEIKIPCSSDVLCDVNTCEVLMGPFGAGGVKLPFGLVSLRLDVKW